MDGKRDGRDFPLGTADLDLVIYSQKQKPDKKGKNFILGEADLVMHDQKHEREERLRKINERLESKKKELESRGSYNNNNNNNDKYPDIKMTGISGSRRGGNKRGKISRRNRKIINRKKIMKKTRGRLFSKKNRSINANNKTQK